MAAKNANDAISMLEVAEGATLEISNMLIRMRELAVAIGVGVPTRRLTVTPWTLEFGALLTFGNRSCRQEYHLEHDVDSKRRR